MYDPKLVRDSFIQGIPLCIFVLYWSYPHYFTCILWMPIPSHNWFLPWCLQLPLWTTNHLIPLLHIRIYQGQWSHDHFHRVSHLIQFISLISCILHHKVRGIIHCCRRRRLGLIIIHKDGRSLLAFQWLLDAFRIKDDFASSILLSIFVYECWYLPWLYSDTVLLEVALKGLIHIELSWQIH